MEIGSKKSKTNEFHTNVIQILEICRHFSFLRAINTLIRYGFKTALQGEQLNPAYRELSMAIDLPNIFRGLIGGILLLLGEKRKNFLLSNTKDGGISTRTLYNVYFDTIHKHRVAWLNCFEELELDCVLYPGLMPAFPHGYAKDLLVSCTYTFIFNILRWPCGSLPVTTVREDEQYYESDIWDSYSKRAQEAMKDSAGMPVGIQIACPEYFDEKCLGCMKVIEEVLARDGLSGNIRDIS